MDRETTHLIVNTSEGNWYIISSLGSRNDTQVIGIDTGTGRLCYAAQPSVDLFPSQAEALESISTKRGVSVKFSRQACALVGCLVEANTLFLLIVTKVKTDLVLPGDHSVQTVSDSEWVRIPLSYPGASTKTEAKTAEMITEYPLDGLHFYCETYDVTRCFPSSHSVLQYDEEYCWNSHLAAPFARMGLREWCCVLLQGLAAGKAFNANGIEVRHAMFSRKSVRNPGTRYVARGLDSDICPGNELECEMIVWRKDDEEKEEAGGEGMRWATYVWRRGTVPIHWKSQLKNLVTDFEIVISERPYEHIDRYYRRLADRYGPNNSVTLVNLLRGTIGHGETLLSVRYQESVQVVRRLLSGLMDVRMISLDWHHSVKANGLPDTVTDLWTRLYGPAKDHGFTCGSLRVSTGSLTNVKVERSQRGVVRVNCADSLDRTNMITFYNAVQVLVELCRAVGGDITVPGGFDKDMILAPYRGGSVDPDGEYKHFLVGYDNFKACVNEAVLIDLAEIFILNGDVCSLLYTNSPAMHTSALREFTPHLPPAPNNTRIILQRRYHNIFDDKLRQVQYEIFLGRTDKYFSPCGSLPHTLTSHASASWIFRALPSSILPVPQSPVRADGAESVLLWSPSPQTSWVVPSRDTTEVYVYLPRYSRVSEVAVTIKRGPASSDLRVTPCSMSVFIGPYLDRLMLALEDCQIPRCDDETRLFFPMPAHISGVKESVGLYDFEGMSQATSRRMRVVRLVFKAPPGAPLLSLGKVELFGKIEDHNESTRSSSSKADSAKLQQQKLDKMVEDIVSSVSESLVMGGGESSVVGSKRSEPIAIAMPHIRSAPELSSSVPTDEEGGEVSAHHAAAALIADSVKRTGSLEDLKAANQNKEGESSSDEDNNDPKPTPSPQPVAPSAKSTAVHSLLNAFKSSRQKQPETAAVLSSSPPPPPPARTATPTLSSSPTSRQQRIGTPPKLSSALVVDQEDSSGAIKEYLAALTRLLHASPPSSGSSPLSLSSTPPNATSPLSGGGSGGGGKQSSRVISFMDALELELLRLRLRISAQQRDTILYVQKERVADFDPNRFIVRRDDKIEEALRKAYRTATCHRCGSPSSLLARHQSCRYCRYSHCKTCMAQHEAKILEYDWDRPERVCVDCHSAIAKQRKIVDEIRALTESMQHQENSLEHSALYKCLYADGRSKFVASLCHHHEGGEGDVCLTDLPLPGILSSVPTEKGSAPVELILAPPTLLDIASHPCWSAPPSCTSVTLTIVLPCFALVKSISLLVDPTGYRRCDIPEIAIAVQERVPHSSIKGTWRLLDHPAEGPVVDWSATVIQGGTTLRHEIEVPSECRLITLKITLPSSPDASAADPARRIHIGRLSVHGRVLSPAWSPAYSASEWSACLTSAAQGSAATQPNRFLLKSGSIKNFPEYNMQDVYVESEAQSSGSSAPSSIPLPIMGFRIDIKHGEEGPLSQVKRVRVSVRNKSSPYQLIVGEFIVPKVASGTSLWFDFPQDKVQPQAEIARFEFLANYGGKEMANGKLTCYTILPPSSS